MTEPPERTKPCDFVIELGDDDYRCIALRVLPDFEPQILSTTVGHLLGSDDCHICDECGCWRLSDRDQIDTSPCKGGA